MEVIAALNKVANYNDFVLITEKITSPDSLDYCNVSLNISLLRDLRKVIEFERRASIQDLGKHFIQSNIAAFVTNVILKSKVQGVWEDIGTPVVSLIQFALTQYIELLNVDFSRWWCSLRIVISSISELCLKYSSLQDLILSHLSEILLRLACITSLPLYAVKHVIKNFNICSLNSKRQLRSKLCPSLQDYFSQIAQSIATCGDFDSQLAFFQTLLRWLVRRSEKEVRIAADRKWFSSSLFPHEARQIFVERKFENFDSDCRDFLNAVNQFSGLVTSINAVSIQIGKIKLKELEQNKQICLDINSGCISIYCDATSFCNPQSKNSQYARLWETIIIMPQIVSKAQLKREINDSVLSLYLDREPEYQLPTSKMMILENYKTLDIQFNKSEDLKRVSTALGRLLGVKYTVQQNMKHLIAVPVQNKTSKVSECFIGTGRSASESTQCNSAAQPHSDEGISSTLVNSTTKKYKKRSSSLSRRISMQHQSSEKKVSRVLLKNSLRRELAPRGTSPSLASSTSTTSLALLGENLRRYQQVNYDKKMDYLAQSPSLSNITEETNANALSVQSSYNNLLTKQNEITKAKSSSIKLPNCNRKNRSISPVVSSDDENFRSLSLLVEQNSFNTNTDIKQQTKNFQDDLLKEAMTQKSVVLLSKLSNDQIEKISREITPTELHNKKTELEENQKGIRKQNEYQATSEMENKTVYDSEETGSDVIVETQKQCKPVKSNVSEKVKLTNPAKILIKQVDFAKNKSDDSSANDVIEATPLVNNSRLLKQKKKVNDCKIVHIQKQFGEETLDNHIVEKHIIDQFFDSHFSQANETTQVNPDKARVNNETSSDSDTNEPVRLIESEVSKPSEPVANDIMQSIKECIANIIIRITEAEVKTYRDKKTKHSSSPQVNLTDRIDSNHKVEKIIETKDATNNDINKNITKFNDTKIPIITNKRRKLYSPGDRYPDEENSDSLISQNDDLMKVKAPDVYGGSASEDCRGKKTVRKKYLLSESDEKYQRARNKKCKLQRTKLSKRPPKSAKTPSEHKLLASKFSNFIETDANKDKEGVYKLLSDSDEFEYTKKTKNMKKKQKQKNRSRNESRKSTISTQHGRLVKACNYAESNTATSANDSSLTTSRDNSTDNSRSRFQKSLSLKHHNNVLSVEKMRKEPNSCLDTELNVMMDEVTIEKKMADDNDVIPKMLEKNISMEEQVNNEIINNIFSKVTSPELNNVSCIENTEIENTVKVRPSKLHSNKSRITIERAKAKTKSLSKNKKNNAKDLNETSESLPPLIVEAVDNERNDDKLDDIKSLTIDKIRKALNRPAETTLDDLQSDVGAMINENMCEVVDSDVFLESNGDILHEPIKTSKKVNKEKEENNLSIVKTIFAVENKEENEQVNINNNNVIKDNTTVNRDSPINAEIKTDSNIQKLTENIVRKDSVNNIQEIITIVDSSQSTKQIKSEKLIEQCDDINVPIPTSAIYISDDETTAMNKVADVSLNTIGESPIRAHVDTTNDLPVTLEDLQRTLSPRQFSDRSINASPEQVLGNRTKRYINTSRFFSECNLWSDSSDSSEGALRMYMNKKPRLSTPQNVNKHITLFCNTPDVHRHNSTKLTENSSGLLFNLSALTAHISPIKCNFSRNDTKNQKTQNDIFNVQEEHQVISKNKLATPPLMKEITLDNSTNDMMYKTTDCHISPIKLAPFLHSDTDTSLASDSNLSPTINRKGKVMTLLDSDSERNVAAACSLANSKVNNLRGIQLSPEDDENSDGPTSDTDLSMHSEPRREPSLQPDLCSFDLKSRWKSLETQLAHISETDAQLGCRFAALEDCLRDVFNLREQKNLQNAKLEEDIIEIRKLLSKVLDT